jgi:tetratricopeptide (TPR) repeat protein
MDDFLLQLKELSKNKETKKIEAFLSEMVTREPNNTEWLLRLAIVELDPPFADYYKSLELLEKVLTQDPNNITAVLIKAYVKHFCLGGVDEALLHKINSIKTESNEEKSMLAFITAWFYQDQQLVDSKSKELHEGEMHCLLESIRLCDKHVWNHWRLAELYIEENRLDAAKKHMQRALSNIVKVYSDTYDNCDETDVEEFINGRIKGIYQEKVTIASFQKDLDKLPKSFDA